VPTFFHSDLDRGFSIIDYDINEEIVSPDDLKEADKLNIKIKLDLVLNHQSVRSPQFIDLMENGNESPYRDFFIDWNKFWRDRGHGCERSHRAIQGAPRQTVARPQEQAVRWIIMAISKYGIRHNTS
jgi:glycosidase